MKLFETVNKKNIESVIMLIPKGGGGNDYDHTFLDNCFQYMKPICMALESP